MERPWSNYTREELLSHIESKHNAMLLAARGNDTLRAELERLVRREEDYASYREGQLKDQIAELENRRRLWKRLAKRKRETLARVLRNTEETEMALRERAIVLGNDLAQERADNEDLRTEIAELKHELRKYEPSDAMMIKLLGLNEAIREAAELIKECCNSMGFEDTHLWAPAQAWLDLPVVKAAQKFVREVGR
jgi:chromosome segregation ATPase